MGSNWTQACGIYAELWAFVRRPRWIESQRDWDGLVWRKLFLLFLLDVAVVIVSLLLIMGYEQALNLLNLPVPKPPCLSRRMPALSHWAGCLRGCCWRP